jgi:hypothetical protein
MICSYTYQEFLDANGLAKTDIAEKIDELYGAGTYDSIKENGTAPSYQLLKGL